MILFIFLNNKLALGTSIHNNKIGTITGKVLLPNGEPAIGAMIGILNSNQYAVSDSMGSYKLTKLKFGEYALEVSTIEANSIVVKLKLAKEIHEFDIKLEKYNIHDLNEIIVTSKSDGQKIKERGFSLDLIDAKKSVLTSLQSTDLLDRAAGIKLRQSGGMGSDIKFNINGLSGNSVRIFIDGLPIRSYGSSFSLSSIPTSMIERIEIYKGVIPAHLSEDALGGAVNIILKQSSSNNLNASYTYGSFNTHRADVVANYRSKKNGFTAGVSSFYNYTDNSYDVWGDQIFITDNVTGKHTPITARRFHDSYQSAGVNAKIGFTRTKWADRLLLGGLFSDMKKDIQHGATMQTVYGNRKSSQRTQLVNLIYEKRDIVKGLDVSVFGSYSSGLRKLVDTISHRYTWTGDVMKQPDGSPILWNKGGGEAGKATLEENIEQNISARANISYSIVQNQKIGVNWLYDGLVRDADDVLLTSLERSFIDTRYLTKNIMSISYDSQYFDNKLSISTFYKRYSQNVKLSDPQKIDGVMTSQIIDRNIGANGYGGAISYRLIPEINLTFSGEHAVRLPDQTELLGDLSQSVEASYELRPESSLNFNIGANIGTFVIADEHNFSGEVNFFYRDIKDMIERGSVNELDDTYGYENLGKVLSMGFDFDFRYNWKNMLYFNYTMSNFNARFNLQYDEHGVEYAYYNDRLRNSPYLTMNSGVMFVKNNVFMKGSQLSIGYNVSYVHGFYKNWESLGGSESKATIPAQFTHDIGIVYRFPKQQFSLSFDVKNIFNEQIFDNWGLQKPGRAFYVKVTYNLF